MFDVRAILSHFFYFTLHPGVLCDCARNSKDENDENNKIRSPSACRVTFPQQSESSVETARDSRSETGDSNPGKKAKKQASLRPGKLQRQFLPENSSLFTFFRARLAQRRKRIRAIGGTERIRESTGG